MEKILITYKILRYEDDKISYSSEKLIKLSIKNKMNMNKK